MTRSMTNLMKANITSRRCSRQVTARLRTKARCLLLLRPSFLAWLFLTFSAVASQAWASPTDPVASAESPVNASEEISTALETPALSGESLYANRCASCHGGRGEGVADLYSEPLTGDRSTTELAAYIDQFMPEGEPEAVSPEEAGAIANYIHQAFYSPAAQGKLHPPRVELSRLTNQQFVNCVADLAASFQNPGRLDHERGLSATLYSREMRKRRRGEAVVSRVDLELDFDYGEHSPAPERLGGREFTILWEGGLLVSQPGTYTFTLEAKNGARLWVNDLETPLIDASVRSGEITREQATLALLAGRAYPVRVQLFKSADAKEVNSGLRLLWKKPSGLEEVIPAAAWVPHDQSEQLLLTTPLPPDDRSTGFERGNSISRDWDRAVSTAALEASEWVVRHRHALCKVPEGSEISADQAATFVLEFAGRAFRRPLADAERQGLTGLLQQAGDVETQLTVGVLFALKHPAFLYRDLPVPDLSLPVLPDYQAAAWLALGLWDSLPDSELLAAAAAGNLHTLDQLQEAARRMVQDPRAKSKLRGVLQEWLRLDRLHDLNKEVTLYPGFDAPLAAELRESLDLTLDQMVWSGTGRLKDLFTDPTVLAGDRMAAYYGFALPPGKGLRPVAYAPEQRAGIITHPLLMAGFAYHGASSPIHRGVFLTRNVLGRVMRPPQVAVSPASPDEHPGLTTRERVALQTSPEMCQGCHVTINSLGFALENWDATGRFRAEEAGKPVDPSGSFRARDGSHHTFQGAKELSAFLATSPEVQRSFVKRMFQCVNKHPLESFNAQLQDRLQARFQATHGDVRDLFIACVAEAAWEQIQAVPDAASVATAEP